MDIPESAYYNAVAITMGGDYRRIKKARGTFADWRGAYHRLRDGELFGTPAASDPEEAFDLMRRAEVRLLLREDAAFPPYLREIPHAPFGIYVRGNIKEEAPRMSIVGTRRATTDGKLTASQFARELCAAGFTVVSGLAFGIDAAAHAGALAALESGASGNTIAVLAGGLNAIYPETNERLALKILASGGAIVSEYPLGEPPYPGRFIERNRIVSGLSQGVLIVEAPEHSGALATARFAFEQSRDLFVAPGPITHTNFKGSHALIRQGAELVTCAQDILDAYGITRRDAHLIAECGASPAETLILSVLRSSRRPLSVDKIIEAAKLEPRIVNQTISFLLMKHLIKESGTGYTI